MTSTLFPRRSYPVLDTDQGGYPIHRIFCVGRNYAAHAAEMGQEVDRDAPFYFLKNASSFVASGCTLPYPPATTDLHHEVELVVALGRKVFQSDVATAANAIGGYGCGLDMTRRDLQSEAKEKRRSWDLAKNFENSAILSPLVGASSIGNLGKRKISLAVNGTIRQSATLSDMIWSVPEIIADLSRFYHLAPGDLIMTGTPAGVGTVVAGDQLRGGIEGIAEISAFYI